MQRKEDVGFSNDAKKTIVAKKPGGRFGGDLGGKKTEWGDDERSRPKLKKTSSRLEEEKVSDQDSRGKQDGG